MVPAIVGILKKGKKKDKRTVKKAKRAAKKKDNKIQRLLLK